MGITYEESQALEGSLGNAARAEVARKLNRQATGGGGQDNNPNNIASDFQPAISTGFGNAQVSYGGGPLMAPKAYQAAAGNTPQFILDMTQAERDAIEKLEGEPDFSNAQTPYASSVALLREQDQKIGLLEPFISPINTLGQVAYDTSSVDLPYTNPYTEQTIYQRPDGTYYGKNFLGLPYNVNEAGEDITDYQQSKDLLAFMDRNSSKDSSPAPAPVATAPAGASDPESTTFDPNNAFLRNRMRMQQEQGGGIMPMPFPKGQPPVTGGPAILPPQIPRLPSVGPPMPPQLRGIMGLADRSNISPAMRYAAENYYRLGGRQMMNDEFERGRSMVQGQSV
tara:strand:+ start:196 stop:1212 length:1017 start_codon:yes stop_codon:yes gene_type:complete